MSAHTALIECDTCLQEFH